MMVTSLLLAGCRSDPDRPVSKEPATEGPSPVVSVETTGRGADMSEARQAAILAGMRQVVGEFIDARTLLVNDELVLESIESFLRSGEVRSAQLGQARSVPGGVEVRMRIWVTPSAIAGGMEAFRAADANTLDGAAIADEIRVAAGSHSRQQDLADRIITDTESALLTASFVRSDGRTSPNLDRNDVKKHGSGATIDITVEVRFDRSAWERELRPRLREFLEASASRVAEGCVQLITATGPHSERLITSRRGILPGLPVEPEQTWVALPRTEGDSLISLDAFLVPSWLARSLEQRLHADDEIHAVVTCVDRAGRVLDRTDIRFDGGRWTADNGLEWQWNKTVGEKFPRITRRASGFSDSIYFFSRSPRKSNVVAGAVVVAPWWWLRDPRGLHPGLLPAIRFPISLDFGLGDLDRLDSIRVHVPGASNPGLSRRSIPPR